MPTSPMKRVVKHLRRAALLQDGAGQTDGQLLAWFIERRDEAAFEALVRRHGPMVMNVCRRLLLNHHDAEDAFQATFLVLVRKAVSIAPPDMLANWLYGVARRTALRAKASSAKRGVRERQMPALPEPKEAQQGDFWHQLLPLLDQELGRLPDKYRVPIILCDLEGRPIKEAARHLGWPQGTLAGRLARARTMLAKRLARHGPMLSGGALAAVLSESTASACVPTFLVSSTVKAATVLAAGQAALVGLISVKVAALTEGVLKGMMLTKLKTVTVGLLVLAMIAYGGEILTHQVAAGQQTKADQKSETAVNQNASMSAEVKKDAFRLEVVPGTQVQRYTATFQEENSQPQFMIETKLVEVEPDGKSRIITRPQICALEDQVAQVEIANNAASVFPNTADLCGQMKIGTRFQIKIKRVDAGKAQIDLALSTCKVEKAEKADTLIVGNGVRAVKQVEIGKRSTIILSQDHEGKPQLWFELTIRESSFKPGPIPLPDGTAPARTLRAAPKEQTPENPGASWPFIN